jgi:hypothetical protein
MVLHPKISWRKQQLQQPTAQLSKINRFTMKSDKQCMSIVETAQVAYLRQNTAF